MSSLKDKRLFLMDMDGTIYLDETLFDGTMDFLKYVKSIGGRYIFITNNSSKGTEDYVAKMKRLGIEACADDFLTSADVTIDYLKKNYGPETGYYICGTKSLMGQFERAGLKVAAEEDADVVVLGCDTELTYEKLCACVRLINKGAGYIATHPDTVCPVSFGFAPDCGSVITMLEACTKKRPKVIGKPEPEIALAAIRRTGFKPEETVVIGDRLYTDIACGVNAGVDTVFVLSGEGVREDIEKCKIYPTFIMSGIREVVNEIKQ
ncbi:MAG: HAD-IIA family hydrolase [Eubacteriales bacterium]|nr:HAD-IIA family hydrolase [Eubacteriales bacterium]